MKQHLSGKVTVGMAILVSAMWSGPLLAEPGQIDVQIERIESFDGFLLVGLCLKDDFLTDICIQRKKIDLVDESSLLFSIFPEEEGEYAVQIIHDKNANLKLDFGWFGVPLEPVGLSGNPVLSFSKPTFQLCGVSDF